MSTTDLKSRLISLKNITQDLKETTTSPQINIQHVKTLINDLKELSENPNRLQREQSKSPSGFQSTPNLQKMSQDSDQPFVYQSVFRPVQNGYQKQESIHEQEILALREENLKMEEKILLLKEQLSKRQQPRPVVKQQKQTELPYFKHTDFLSIFVCRFDINQDDIRKIQYNDDKVELHLDKIVVTHRQKGTIQEFDLTTLQEVTYQSSSNVVLYRLQEFIEGDAFPVSQRKDEGNNKKNFTNIFVKYHSQEQMKKWDLSIFCNYQLACSLHVDRVFQKHFRRIKYEEEENKENQFMRILNSKEELTLAQQKQLLQYFLKKKGQFSDLTKIVQEKIPLPNKEQSRQSQIKPKPKEPKLIPEEPQYQIQVIQPEPKPIEFQYHPVQHQYVAGQNENRETFSTLTKSLMQNLLPQPQEEKPKPQIKKIVSEVQKPITPIKNQRNKLEEEKKQTQEEKYKREHRFSFSKDQEDHIIPQTDIKKNQIKQSNEQLWYSQNYRKGPSFGQQSPIDNLTQSGFNSRNNHPPLKVVQNKVNLAQTNLQKGYFVTKYSKDGFFPHEKKVFLSLDCKKLCWCQKDRQTEYKSVPVEVIIKVEYGVVGDGIDKHISKNVQNPSQYCVIQHYTGSDYKKKTIELSGPPHQILRFSQQLQVIINFNKGISLNTLVQS